MWFLEQFPQMIGANRLSPTQMGMTYVSKVNKYKIRSCLLCLIGGGAEQFRWDKEGLDQG